MARCPNCGFVFKTHAQICWRKVPMSAAMKEIRSFEMDMKKHGDDRTYQRVLEEVKKYGMDDVFSPHDIAKILGVDWATNHDKIRVCLHYLVCLGEISNKRFDVVDTRPGQSRKNRGHLYQRSNGVECTSLGKDKKGYFRCMSKIFSVVK